MIIITEEQLKKKTYHPLAGDIAASYANAVVWTDVITCSLFTKSAVYSVNINKSVKSKCDSNSGLSR